MPCSKCGWSGHNRRTCINYQVAISPDVLSMPITFDEFNQPEVVRNATSDNPFPEETKSINNLPQDCPLLELDYGILTEQIGPIVQQMRRKKHWDRMDFLIEQLGWKLPENIPSEDYLALIMGRSPAKWYKSFEYLPKHNIYFYWVGHVFNREWRLDFKKIKQPNIGIPFDVIIHHLMAGNDFMEIYRLLQHQRLPTQIERYRYKRRWLNELIQALKDIDIPLVYLEEVYAKLQGMIKELEIRKKNEIRKSVFKHLPKYVPM